MPPGDGDRVVRCGLGHLHWGSHGAAGLLPAAAGHVLLQQRALWTPGGGRWGTFGGALDSHEDPVTGALRETAEEGPWAALTASAGLKSIAGGGDTVSALKHAGVADRMTYVSAAGGAFLEWLEGKTLPGVAALEI